MFKKKKPLPTGAKEKVAAAERMRRALREEAEKKYGVRSRSQAIPVTLVFALATGLAAVLVMGSNPAALSWHPTGILPLDKLLFDTHLHKITGDPDMDRTIVILIRAVTIFLFTAIAPLFGALLYRLFGGKRLNPFIACWAALIALPLLVYPVRDPLWSLISNFFHGL